MLIPKGKLIAIGGAEDKGTGDKNGNLKITNLNFFELGILRRIVEESGAALIRKLKSLPQLQRFLMK